MSGGNRGFKQGFGLGCGCIAAIIVALLVLLALAVLLTLQVVGSETRFSRRSQTQTKRFRRMNGKSETKKQYLG